MHEIHIFTPGAIRAVSAEIVSSLGIIPFHRKLMGAKSGLWFASDTQELPGTYE